MDLEYQGSGRHRKPPAPFVMLECTCGQCGNPWKPDCLPPAPPPRPARHARPQTVYPFIAPQPDDTPPMHPPVNIDSDGVVVPFRKRPRKTR